MMVTTKTNTSIRSVQTMRLVKFPLKNIDIADAQKNSGSSGMCGSGIILPNIEEDIDPIEHQVGDLCSKNDIIEIIRGVGQRCIGVFLSQLVIGKILEKYRGYQKQACNRVIRQKEKKKSFTFLVEEVKIDTCIGWVFSKLTSVNIYTQSPRFSY